MAGAHGDLDEISQTILTADGKQALEEASRPGSLQIIVIGNGSFATHPLPEKAALVLGRGSQADIRIEDKSISRRHALLKVGDQLTIEDLGSANGSVVRGNRLAPKQVETIGVGELVALGSASIIVQQRARPIRARRLWTHDYFEARLEEECARVERSGSPFVLLRIQVDRRTPEAFVEETLGELVRESDVLGKYGPHEYEVLMPDTPADDCEDIVRRIQTTLRDRRARAKIAHACCPSDGRTAHQLTAHLQDRPTSELAPLDKTKRSRDEVVVTDPQMQSLYRLVEQVAASNISVLLLGETGVGKEVFAQAVHRASARAKGPFVEINCAALTEALLESELFGHEKGAFTNAQSAKPGLLELADGGTLLLDEIGDMPLGIQVKLLRVLENSQLRRVGSVKTRTIDVRFVAATNTDLEEQVARGGFRRDLFYRLNGVTIVIPPLRERLAEIEPLAKIFIRRAWVKRTPPPVLAPDALELMRSYSWPGNVRELKHVIERAVLLCGDGPIRTAHLPAEKMRTTLVTARPTPVPARRASSEMRAVTPLEPGIPLLRRSSEEEQQRIMQALERTGGNQTAAARMLGISRRTLLNRLDEYQLERPRKKPPAKR